MAVTEHAEQPSVDQTYWASVYLTHRQAMLAAAVRKLGLNRSHLGQTAQSVVQDVMRGLIEKGQALTAVNAEAYLVAAVKNRATDVLRQESRRHQDRPGLDEDGDEVPDVPTEEDIAEAATDALIRDQTQEILADMDPRHRQAFIERVWRDRPFTEIGPEMGVSDSYAGRLFREALAEIRKRLGVEVIDYDEGKR